MYMYIYTSKFSGLVELSSPAVAAARARAALSRSSGVIPGTFRAANNRTALASSVRLVELGREREREREGEM